MATTHQSRSGSTHERWPTMGSHETNMSEMERNLSMAGGAALALFSLNRLSKTGLILLAGGLYAIYRGANGHCHVYEQLGIDRGEK